MSKYIIRLSESELHEKVKNAVNEILNDFSFSSSWLTGEYPNIGGYRVSIDSARSFIAFEELQDSDNSYVFQGDEAEQCLDEIMQIWNQNEEMSAEDAIAQWINWYL